jgi:hypothetical protein
MPIQAQRASTLYHRQANALYAPDPPPMTTSPSASFFSVPFPFPFVGAAAEAGLDLDFGFPPFVFSAWFWRCFLPPVPSSSESDNEFSFCFVLSHKRSSCQFVPSGIDGEIYELFVHPYLLHLRAHYPSRCHATSGVPLVCQLIFIDGGYGSLHCCCTLGAASLSLRISKTFCFSFSRYFGVLWSVIFEALTSRS